jgi:hypothetical protein
MKNILFKLFGKVGGSIAEKISGIVDKHTFSKVEKAQFEKEMSEVFIKAEAEIQENITERWKVDLQHGNWLTRSVRPLVLIFLILSTILMVFIDSGSILLTVIGAYFGGRSIEKIKKTNK